ncbi:MAG: Lrp/AsnC ligand binding domain-containing protein [Dehalococcoidia bacterium]|nr:Lrp/AsnC ligand binding domain-containing protein [Chloroflexota bacterium]
MIKAYVLINSETAYTYQVVEKIKGISGVVEIHEVLGPYDIVAEVEAADIDSILHILRQEIRVILGVRNTVTCITTD